MNAIEILPIGPLDQLTQLNKAAGDSLRLSILRALKAESFGVLELCSIFELLQPRMSHHLKILATAGLLATRKEANSVFYRRALIPEHAAFAPLILSLMECIDSLELSPQQRARIEVIKAERAQVSQQFFAKNAQKFQEKQALIAHHSQYSGGWNDLIQQLPLQAQSRVIEIGPGDGAMLIQLAQQFDQVIGIDNSSAMLEQARCQLAAKQCTNVELLQGEPADAVAQGLTADLVTLNMVLHHMSSPAKEFQHFAKILAPGGHLLVVDLCQHNQQWVRENCGDLWLGFDPDEIDAWATDAGLTPGPSLYLGLRNGFQVQMRVFQQPQNQGAGTTP